MAGFRVTSVLVVLFGCALVEDAVGQAPSASPPSRSPAPHGTPKGWRFSWPKGDPARGRETFARFECHSCHEVRGESFPRPSQADRLGPELSQMGPLHEAEVFAEAIVNPSAVIERGKGYAAPDGSSKMPSYNDSITVQEVSDLVAYLRSLRPAAGRGTVPPRPARSGGHTH